MADNRIKQISEAVKARDAVLLSKILENMDGSERASVLSADRYGSSKFPGGKSPLVTAVENGDLDSVKVLLKYTPNTDVRKGLSLSAANGYTDILRCFIENGADINACGTYHNCTPLMLAIENGHANAVNVLLQYGANVARTDDSGFTALHYACEYNGSPEVLSFLISNGADVDARSSYNPVFSVPSENGYADMKAARVRTVNTSSDNGVTPLMIAARESHLNVVTFLIKEGADVSLPDYDGRTALHFAVGSSDNSCEILSCLIENGADINKRRMDNQTPLMVAVEKGLVSVATFLIEHGADVDLQNENGNTALHYALYGSDVSCEILSCLIGSGADVNGVNKVKHTPLMIAAKRGHLNALTLLIKHGAHDVDLQDSDGYTALHYAVYGSDISCEILSCLIGIGADVNARTNNGVTPLMIAAEEGHINAVTSLVKCGANVDLQDKDGQTALDHALYGSDVSSDILSCLIGSGADVNARRNNRGTPLMIAAENGHINAVTTLVKCGANVDLQDEDGQTALHYAMSSPEDSICEVLSCLIKNGADVNAHAFHNETPLMLASCRGPVDVVTFLIEHGADVKLQDKDGDTALHYAARFSPNIVKKLLNLGASHMCNHQGLTPLHEACICGNIPVVEYLIQRPEITKEQRVDALELYGASFATHFNTLAFQPFFVEEGLKYIKRGMQERYVDPSQPILKQPKEPAYGNRKESQTPEELAQIEGDTEAILMESLIIKERILGTNNIELLQSIRFVCSSCNLTDPSLRIALYSRAVDIAQKSNLSACDDYFSLMRYFLRKIMRSGNNHLVKEEDLLELLRQIVSGYKLEHAKRRRNDDEKYVQEEILEDLFCCSMQLVSIMSKFEFCDERTASKVSKLLEELSSQDPRNSSGNSLLHVFIERCSFYNDSSSCFQAVNLLLNEGFNVNVVNNEGNTPLHLAVTLEPWNDKIYLLTEILRLLFDGGAHHDFVNNDGKTPMDMAESDEARMILSERRKLELKCISARAVKRFGIPYLGVVPKILEKYISMH